MTAANVTTYNVICLLQSHISELETALERELREGRQEWEKLQVSLIDEQQEKIAALEKRLKAYEDYAEMNGLPKF